MFNNNKVSELLCTIRTERINHQISERDSWHRRRVDREEIDLLQKENKRLADENFELAGNLDILTVENRNVIDNKIAVVREKMDLIESLLLNKGILPILTAEDQLTYLWNENAELKKKLAEYVNTACSACEGVDKP